MSIERQDDINGGDPVGRSTADAGRSGLQTYVPDQEGRRAIRGDGTGRPRSRVRGSIPRAGSGDRVPSGSTSGSPPTSASWRPATAAKNRSAIERHWLPRLGTLARSSIAHSAPCAAELSTSLVADFQPATVRSYYGSFRSMIGAAVDMEVIGRSPCRGIKLPAAKTEEKRVVTPAELHDLADAIGPGVASDGLSVRCHGSPLRRGGRPPGRRRRLQASAVVDHEGRFRGCRSAHDRSAEDDIEQPHTRSAGPARSTRFAITSTSWCSTSRRIYYSPITFRRSTASE